MLCIYYFTVVSICKRVIPVLEGNLFLDFSDKGIFYVCVAVNIIGSDTCLAAVEIFAEYDTFGGNFKIGAPVYDAWALAAEFK